ncbi:MAG: dephospho-CoA kinase [Steroidobacteraceae bacterium]
MESPRARRLRVGLTGGIASGKSTVSRLFAELGVPIVDADEISRRVVEPGTPGLAAVVDRFGREVLDDAGHLDRAALRARVFADPGARRDLESILHPLIRAMMDADARKAAGPYVILAIPLLVEGDGRNRVDRVLVVDAEEDTQLGRVVARDRVPESQARAILAAQASRARRLAAADDVIRNEGSVADLRQAVESLHQRYLRLAHERDGLPSGGAGSQ